LEKYLRYKLKWGGIMKKAIIFLAGVLALSSCNSDLLLQQGVSEKALRDCGNTSCSAPYQDIEGIDAPTDNITNPSSGSELIVEARFPVSLSPDRVTTGGREVKIEWNNRAFSAESVSINGVALPYKNIPEGAAINVLGRDEGIYQVLVVLGSGGILVQKTLNLFVTDSAEEPATIGGIN
jgi:hypothetical protein